ncbi:MAG: hypothetical protein CSA63_02085 [Propionibacterium sp.]|nr:MAG: hypothetical protein CSA63_02085 [Propionibacterium sp.]
MIVDPAKIRINMDYGWLRAAEMHLGLAEDAVERHRDIISTRMTCLQLEGQWRQEPESAEVLAALREAKLKLRELVAGADASVLPSGAAHWWHQFERESEEPVSPPWLADD